jgi:DNA repair exonuclease SbcCD ATPase subunit
LNRYEDYDPVHDVSEELRQAKQRLQLIDCENKIKQYQQTLAVRFQSLQDHARTLTEDDISSPDLDIFLSLEYDFSTTRSLIKILDNAIRFLNQSHENKDFTIPDEISRHIGHCLQLTEQLDQTQQNITKIVTEINSRYREARTVFKNKKRDGLEVEVSHWEKRKAQFDLLNNLTDLEDQIVKLEEIARKLSSLNEYIQALDDARSTLHKTKETLLREAIDRISERVNEIYANMNPDEALNQIKFRSSGEGSLDIIVDDQNAKISDKEPRPQAFLSEGHLNCLGIAIHLALQEIIDTPYDFVIFDDPIYSIDAGHRIRALDEMFDFANKTNKQLIIATHDPLFFNYLKEGLWLRRNEINSSQIYIVANHSSTRPYIVEESSNASFLDEAKEKLSQGCTSYELETAYVFLRREIEYICKELLEGQRIAVYGEPYKKLASRIELLRRLDHVDEGDVNKLQWARRICNPAAHDDPQGREGHTIANQVLRNIENFRDKYMPESPS